MVSPLTVVGGMAQDVSPTHPTVRSGIKLAARTATNRSAANIDQPGCRLAKDNFAVMLLAITASIHSERAYTNHELTFAGTLFWHNHNRHNYDRLPCKRYVLKPILLSLAK